MIIMMKHTHHDNHTHNGDTDYGNGNNNNDNVVDPGVHLIVLHLFNIASRQEQCFLSYLFHSHMCELPPFYAVVLDPFH